MVLQRRGRRSTVTPASRRPGKKSTKKDTPAVEDTNSDTSDDEESVSSTSQQHTHSKVQKLFRLVSLTNSVHYYKY
jgi:hypothetical protein